MKCLHHNQAAVVHGMTHRLHHHAVVHGMTTVLAKRVARAGLAVQTVLARRVGIVVPAQAIVQVLLAGTNCDSG